MPAPLRVDNRVVYLDNNATTRLDPRVLERMLPALTDEFGNASSAHTPGRRASAAVDKAREQVAALVGGPARGVVFTSGATEANNLALRGATSAAGGRHVITWRSEHPAVLETAVALRKDGIDVTLLDLTATGNVDLDALAAALRPDTALVSIMAANNETGIANDVRAVSLLAKRAGAVVHCDATQAAGKIPISMAEWGVNLLSLSAHKFHGPQGVGALVSYGRTPLTAQVTGGGQERGLRSGTLNVPGIVGLGAAAELAADELPRMADVAALRDHLQDLLRAGTPDVSFIGETSRRLPTTALACWPGLEADAVLSRMTDIAVSTGSACSSQAHEPSPTLRAMGMNLDQAAGCLRLSLSRETTRDDIEYAASRIATHVTEVRNLMSGVTP